MTNKYKLTITEHQASVINRALDFYSRMLIGQVREIKNVYKMERNFNDLPDHDQADEAIEKVRELYFPGHPSNGSFGIYSPEVPDSARIAWDIQQVIRHRIAWRRAGDPSERDWSTMTGVTYDEPMKSSSKEDLPKIEDATEIF